MRFLAAAAGFLQGERERSERERSQRERREGEGGTGRHREAATLQDGG